MLEGAPEPERKLAVLLLKRSKQWPPVDVQSLVGAHATIEYADFPTTCDCLLIRRPNHRPRLVISSRVKVQNRLRFTLAHELGHLILPWQSGSVFCHADYVVRTSDEISRRMEAEANRFAAELLVPTIWVTQQLVPTEDGAQQILKVADRAGVSPVTAMFSVARASPAGTLYLVLDTNGRAHYVAASPGSLMNLPQVGEPVDISSLLTTGATVHQASYGQRTLVVVRFLGPQPTSILLGSQELSTKILERILVELFPDPKERRSASSSINGVIGSANVLASAEMNPESILGVLHQRFVGRPRLDRVLRHSLFKSFLSAKAAELAARRQSR